jgi:hypothetical protein
MAADVLAALTRSPKQERFMSDDELEALQASGLKGKALEKGASIVSGASSGEEPSEQTFQGAKAFVDQFEQKLSKKPEYQKAEPAEQKAIADAELQKTAKESMSDRELVGRLLIGFVPTLLGAAIGRGTGLGTGLGGAAGGEAALAGLKQLDFLQEAQKKEAKETAKSEAEKAKSEREFGLKERELEQKIKIEQIKAATDRLKATDKEATATEAKGKTVTAEQAKMIAGINSSEKQLADIEADIEKNADVMGPIAGRLTGLSPYATETRAFDARMKIAAQKIGVALEGRGLTDADIVRYRAMLPNLTDTPEVGRAKVGILRQLMQQEKQAQLESMGAGGYEVSRYASAPQADMIQPMQTLPSGLKLPGQISSAVASEKPKRVIQNGVEYIYNPATGRYE